MDPQIDVSDRLQAQVAQFASCLLPSRTRLPRCIPTLSKDKNSLRHLLSSDSFHILSDDTPRVLVRHRLELAHPPLLVGRVTRRHSALAHPPAHLDLSFEMKVQRDQMGDVVCARTELRGVRHG